jgi:hypothetical protein
MPVLAWAHPAPNSAVLLDIGRDSVALELQIAASELKSAIKALGSDISSNAAAQDRGAVSAYLLRHIGATDDRGLPWAVSIQSISTGQLGDDPALVARLSMTPPVGSSARTFSLRFDAITHEVRSHVAVVMLRTDFYSGRLGPEPAIVGVFQHPATAVHLQAGDGGTWITGLRAAFHLGVHHILEGADHLLFLLMLLLPAALVAVGRRWQRDVDVRRAWWRMLWTVSAFTAGHACSLVAAVLFGLSVYADAVEVLVAMSILVTAVHASRPLFAGREPLLAGAFGLIHGLAFAGAITAFALEPLPKAVTLVGFNAGVECVQLVLVAAILPLVVWLTRMGMHDRIRNGVAAMAGSVSLFWMYERFLRFSE